MPNALDIERTFGLEIEFKSLHAHEAVRVIRAAGVECTYESYDHVTRDRWRVTSDQSVDNGWEVVSPVLPGNEFGFEQVRRVMDALATAGATVDRQCGLHVHIGAKDFSTSELRTIAKNYITFEHFFDAIMPASRRGVSNVYIKSNRAAFGGYDYEATARAHAALNAARSRNVIIALVNPLVDGDGEMMPCSRCASGTPHRCNGRYRKLNLTAWFQHGTIEFRQHSGTVEADKAINWVRLLIQFVNRAKVTRQRPSRREHSLSASFRAFFRAFAIDKAGDDIRRFYEGRKRGFHGSN